MRALPLALAILTVTCVPELGTDDSRITSPRILAVRAEPAEAKPGAELTFTVLVASVSGTVTDAEVAWSFCTAPKPVTEDNIVSSACLASSALVRAGTGPSITTAIPTEACARFGPDMASTSARPRDPDATGGYYQPLRASLAGDREVFALARIRCNLAAAGATAASAFAAAYVPNENPRLLPLRATQNGAPIALTSVPRGAHLTLEASWSAESVETFAYFDPASRTVTTQRETMQVAWYATDGAFDPDATGTEGWRAPSTPGLVHLWVVLRDNRGGVDFASYDAQIVP